VSEFGLVPACLQSADAGGFLEQRAPLARLRVDQPADPPLADQRRRLSAAGSVREQDLNIASALFAAVDTIGRATLPVDPPLDLQLVQIVEMGRRGAVAIIDRQRDGGDIPGRPGRCAAEDDVIHLTAAQASGRGLAHHPLQRLDEIRLAAAVGADDSRETGLDEKFRRLDEGLEAGQSKLGEMHAG
jgi:hypothetical protein